MRSVWIGLYIGVVDGAFGKRTRDSILAWQHQRQGAGETGWSTRRNCTA